MDTEPSTVTDGGLTQKAARAASELIVGLDTVEPPATGRDYPGLLPVMPEHYVIEGPIAQGGMGHILRARDRRLGREVALKEVHASSPHLAARLEREARITARLHHPSIVTVHEAGVWPGGAPFFAMEIVAGRPLDEAIQAAGSEVKRLALLPHAIAVADAVAYAHSRGIIHRDLKPANVMVGEFGETVVIDWGLAKDLSSSAEPLDPRVGPRVGDPEPSKTDHGSILGTPAYMPPEQARGELADERADVFAIGTILFHLLVGRPPFQGRTQTDVLEQVLANKPARLETLAPDAPPDLVAIVRKAMAYDREARYPSARELAEDLRRFQTGQLVAARRYSTTQRLRRFLARHRVVVSVGAAAAVVITALSVYGAVRIVRERDTAIAARQDADQQREISDQRRGRAEKLRAASEDLVGFMLVDLKPQLARAGRLHVMKGIGAKIDAYYQRLDDAKEELDDIAWGRRAVALRTLGDVIDDYGDKTGSKRAYEAALAAGGALSGSPAIIEAARARIGLAWSLEESGDLDGAVKALDQVSVTLENLPSGTDGADLVLALAYRRAGAIHARSRRPDDAAIAFAKALKHATAAASTGDRIARAEIAKIHDRLSDLKLARLDSAGALDSARAGMKIREQLGKEDPGDIENQVGLSVSFDKLIRIAIRNEDQRSARDASGKAITILTRLVEHDPENAFWGRMLMVAYLRQGRIEAADEHYQDASTASQKATVVAQRLLDLDPNNVDRLQDIIAALSQQATHLAFLNRLDEALSVVRRALSNAKALGATASSGPEHRQLIADLHENMGDILSEQRNFEAASNEYRERLKILEELQQLDPKNPSFKLNIAFTRFGLGDIVADIPARYAEGIALMEQAIEVFHKLRDAGQLDKEVLSLVQLREEKLKVEKNRRH